MRFAFLIPALLVWPAFGGECFCLLDADDVVWFDCREQTRPMRTQPLVFCADAATGKQIDLTGRGDLTRVADGDAPCTPCRLSDADDPDHTLRGEDDEEETATGQKNAEPDSSGTPDTAGKERP